MKRKKILKRTGWAILFIFLLMNVIAFFHAYKFTHFSATPEPQTRAGNLSLGGKLKTLLKTFPLAAYEDYLVKYKDEWTKEVNFFLANSQ